MKILNVTKKTVIFILLVALLLSLLLLMLLKTFYSHTIVMDTENFTQILKESHEDPYSYLNHRIICSGYLFRAKDFRENQFVVARDMLVGEGESRIVGFLCESEEIKNFESNEWIQIDGVFTIGNYHGAMPIIQVTSIKKVDTPNNFFVMPPKNFSL